jgi:signal transduction histidine kinase
VTASGRATRRAALTPLSLTTIDHRAVWQRAITDAAETAALVLSTAKDGGWPADELRRAAAAIRVGVESVLHGQPLALVVVPPALPVKRVLSEMRRALLAQSRGGDLAPADTVAILDALETIGRSLDAHAAHRFTSRLGGLGGLELIVDVAHDMRSPLGSILFLAEQIRQGRSGPVGPVQERQLGLIYSAALGLSTLASDVMDLARGGETLVQDSPAPFSIGSVFQQVQDVIRPMAEERSLAVSFDAGAVDARVGHGRAVHRIVLNLVSNAIKFTDRGSVSVTAACGEGDLVTIEVTDTGRGIPEELMGTLFDAFRRRVTPGQYVFSSAGLGLSICQNLLTAMQSELTVQSTPGVGTTFRFTLALPVHRLW